MNQILTFNYILALNLFWQLQWQETYNLMFCIAAELEHNHQQHRTFFLDHWNVLSDIIPGSTINEPKTTGISENE